MVNQSSNTFITQCYGLTVFVCKQSSRKVINLSAVYVLKLSVRCIICSDLKQKQNKKTCTSVVCLLKVIFEADIFLVSFTA